MKRSGGLWWLTPCALTGLIAACLFASGCAVSRISNPFKSGDEDCFCLRRQPGPAAGDG